MDIITIIDTFRCSARRYGLYDVVFMSFIRKKLFVVVAQIAFCRDSLTTQFALPSHFFNDDATDLIAGLNSAIPNTSRMIDTEMGYSCHHHLSQSEGSIPPWSFAVNGVKHLTKK
jgi:hypothetical protein